MSRGEVAAPAQEIIRTAGKEIRAYLNKEKAEVHGLLVYHN